MYIERSKVKFFYNNLCAKKYQSPPLGDIALPLKFQKRAAPWNYNSSKFISTPPKNFREGVHTMYHCIPPGKPEFEPFFDKITICTFPVTFANS